MTKDDALKIALDVLTEMVNKERYPRSGICTCPLCKAITAIEEALKVPVDAVPELKQAQYEAISIAIYIRNRFYPAASEWEPLPDLLGALSQISNMVTGISVSLQAAHDAVTIESLNDKVTYLMAQNDALKVPVQSVDREAEIQEVGKLAWKYAMAHGHYVYLNTKCSLEDARLFAKAEAAQNALQAAIRKLAGAKT